MKHIYITGDTHGEIDIKKLGHKKWRNGRHLSKEDYVIILGDFGVIWEGKQNSNEIYWLKWLNERKYTVLFLDGNHDNFDRLDALPTQSMFGGTVGVASKHIFHLRRGEIYTINDKTFFAFGGALSYDKASRIPGRSWWEREIPSSKEMEYAVANLEKINWKVDYILTHTVPQGIATTLYNIDTHRPQDVDTTRNFLSFIQSKLSFKTWYFGHWHDDVEIDVDNKHYVGRYHQITEID